MIEITQMQKLIGIGKLPRLIDAPTDQRFTNAHISWNTAAICCQVFKEHSTAPVIASCLFQSAIHDDDIMQSLIGYNPFTNLNELEKAIVQYCVILAELHELDCEVIKGNFYCRPALQAVHKAMEETQKLIAELSEKAIKEAEPTEEKPAKKRRYKH